MPESSRPSRNLVVQAAIALDGVYYARLTDGGRAWRLGATTSQWREALAAPWEELTAHGVWLQAEDGPCGKAMAALCCGLGSIWPGMGRELYENFAPAREAMNDIAALADWDVHGLMAEIGFEKISQTRWQIPYLFMLEYAQWRLLRAYGLVPSMLAGHSLGELVALCLAGVYDLPTAWYLLDTRACHMSALEARGRHEQGMLAVPAEKEHVDAALAQWPALRIANRNTRKQYILGGPRSQLGEARKQLRRARIPAIMLNMDLAFHNPAMRILRDLSLIRLNGLTMSAPAIPVLSCVDARLYPDRQADICARIADLDENTVDWVACIETMRDTYGINHFLELGPQETLCGLMGEIYPQSSCIVTDGRGREAETMRIALARLFAVGALDMGRLAAHTQDMSPPALITAPPIAPARIPEDIDPAQAAIVMDILAEVCQRDSAEIRPEQDLRHDLGIGSSIFPHIIMEAERRLNRAIQIETLLPLASVADLIIFLTGHVNGKTEPQPPRDAAFWAARRPLCRFAFANGELAPLPLNPELPPPPARVIAACLRDKSLLPGLKDTAENLAVISIDGADPIHIIKAAAQLRDMARHDPVIANMDGIVLEIPPACKNAALLIDACAQILAVSTAEKPWLMLICRARYDAALAWLAEIDDALQKCSAAWRAVAWIDDGGETQNRHEAADLLAWEIRHGRAVKIVWQRMDQPAPARFCAASPVFADMRPADNAPVDGAIFEAYRQFSRFSQPCLDEHGEDGRSPFPVFGSELDISAPWLPLSEIIGSLRDAAAFVAGNCHMASLADLRIFSLPAMPPGVTRVCRLFASSRLRLKLAGAPSRLCRARMEAAALAPTLRQMDKWNTAAECVWHAAYKAWLHEAAAPDPEHAAFHPRHNLDMFYELAGFGLSWRLLDNYALAEDHMLLGHLAPVVEQSPRLLTDAILQAAILALAGKAGSGEDMRRVFANWRFSGIGLMRFASLDENMPAANNMRILIKPSWSNERLRRFDGQIYTAAGASIIAFRNLEFDRNPLTDSERD